MKILSVIVVGTYIIYHICIKYLWLINIKRYNDAYYYWYNFEYQWIKPGIFYWFLFEWEPS